MKKFLLLIPVAIISTVGCSSVRDQVPASQMTGTYGGQPYSITLPKDESFSNLDVTISTNGSLHVHADSIVAAENPAVITMTGNAYQVMRKADSDLLNSAITTTVGAAGTLGGKAAQAAVKP